MPPMEIEDCTPKYKQLTTSDDYLLECAFVNEKTPVGDGFKREFGFYVTSEKVGLERFEWKKSFFSSQIRELLIGLGGKPTDTDKNKIAIDYSKVPGLMVRCTITVTPGKKDPKYMDYAFSNVVAVDPFA